MYIYIYDIYDIYDIYIYMMYLHISISISYPVSDCSFVSYSLHPHLSISSDVGWLLIYLHRYISIQ